MVVYQEAISFKSLSLKNLQVLDARHDVAETKVDVVHST